MRASVVDLRYKTKDILECLRRRQKVELTCRGKLAGIIVPVTENSDRPPMSGHPAVGMWKDQKEPVPEVMKRLRKPRFHVG
ncbi:MAG: hypothetical protein WC003_11625 [Terrimicrobiaceae bacterium]